MPEGTGTTEDKTFTQEELDEIVKERLQRERGKYADYSELAKKAKAYDDTQAANASELEKLTKRATDAEAALTAMQQKQEHAAMVKKAMSENKIDAKYESLLTASDEEGLAEQAKLLAERFAEPVKSDSGRQPSVNITPDGMGKFAHEMFGGTTNQV